MSADVGAPPSAATATAGAPSPPRLSTSQSAVLSAAADVVLAVVALLTIPWLLDALGVERYGILGLVSVLTAQLAPLQFGIGPAATRRIAELRGAADGAGVATSRIAILAVSLAAAALVAGAGALLAAAAWRKGFRLSPSAASDALLSIPFTALLLAAQPPLGSAMAVLAGEERFGRLAAVRLVHGTLRQVLAAYAAWAGFGLPGSLGAFGLVDAATATVLWAGSARRGPRPTAPLPPEVRRLLALGAPTALGGICSALLGDLEKLAVSSLRSVQDFTYYATPANALLRLTILPAAIAAVLMPRFAVLSARGDEAPARRLSSQASRLSVALTFLLAAPAVALVPELLRTWLGAEFAARASTLSRIVLVGVVAQVAGFPAQAMLRARAKPSVLTLLYAAELVAQALLLALAIRLLGLPGAAVAFAARSIVDAYAQRWLAARMFGPSEGTQRATAAAIASTAALAAGFAWSGDALHWSLRLLIALLLAALVGARLVPPAEAMGQLRRTLGAPPRGA